MKNIWIIPFSALALSLSAVSCTQTDVVDEIQNSQGENNTQGDKDLVWTTFKAYVPQIGNPSRTSLEEGNKVFWNDGDAIAISGRWANNPEEIYKCVTKIEGGKSATADFEGEVSEESQYIAFYPYHLLVKNQNRETYFTIPAIQEAVAGTFANNTNPSWATTDRLGGSLHFKNIGALVKFTLEDGADDLKSVMLVSNNENAKLTGDFIYDFTDVENPSLVISQAWSAVNSSSVTLEGDFKSGCTYYFVVAPQEGILSEGFSLVFEKTDGTHHVVKGSAGVINNVSSSEIVNIGSVNLAGVEFKKNIADFNLIKAVERSYGGSFSWTKDADGTVPLTEENLALIKGIQALTIDRAGLSSLDDLKYFTDLWYLDCSYNNLNSVDLNLLTKINTLRINNSFVSELKIDKLVNLSSLDCCNNNLSSLDLSGASDLTYLVCSNNKLDEIDIRRFSNLDYFDCGDNNISTLDLSNNTMLREFRCCYNPISSLEVGHLTKLQCLDCSNTQISTLDLANLTSLVDFLVSYTGITEISVPSPEKIRTLGFASCPVNQVDLSRYTSVETLYCNGLPEHITELDLSNNTKIRYIDCQESGLTSLNLSECVELVGLFCANCKLSELDLSNNVKLIDLNCSNQNLPDGKKLQLYLMSSQQELWNNISGYHSESVDVHFMDSESNE